MSLPVVSIIIPTFNRNDLLQKTLQSIKEQTFENWEVIVVDDGSNDATEATVLSLSAADTRIRYARRRSSQRGASVCRNEGTALSRGNYVIYLDSDDYLSTATLENRLKEMECHPDLDFGVFQAVLFWDQPGDTRLLWNIETRENDIDRFLAIDIPWQTTSPIWRREALLKLGPWNGTLPSWQDWEYHLRAIIKGLKYKKFSIPDFFWRTSAPLQKQLLPQKDLRSREAISRSPIPGDKLVEYEALFIQIQQLLIEKELFTSKRQALFGGLYYWLALTWQKNKNIAEAIRVWSDCYEKGLINQRVYQQGKFYLTNVANIPLVRRWVRRYLENTWLQEYTVAFSSKSGTQHRIALPAHIQIIDSRIYTIEAISFDSGNLATNHY